MQMNVPNAQISAKSNLEKAMLLDLEPLAAIVEGLWPAVYAVAADNEEFDVYHDALQRATRSLLWKMAWVGALDGAVVYTECGEPSETIVRMQFDENRDPDPVLLTKSLDGCPGGNLLADFVRNLIEGYVGLPETKEYGPGAIVELARHWLASRQSLGTN